MPIYEYLCQACGHELEVIQKLSDDLLKVCPECEKSKLKKKVSAAAFRLSGSGWYETDFKTGDNKKNLSGDKKPKTEGGDKSGSSDGGNKTGDSKKADSKPGGSKDSGSKSKASASSTS